MAPWPAIKELHDHSFEGPLLITWTQNCCWIEVAGAAKHTLHAMQSCQHTSKSTMQVNMQLPRQAKEGGKHLLVGGVSRPRLRQWYLAAIVLHGNSMDMLACSA